MRKIKKNRVIITVMAILIAVAGYINYAGDLRARIDADGGVLKVDNTDVVSESATDENGNAIDNVSGDIISNDAEPDLEKNGIPGETILTSGTGVSESVISSAKLNREQIRAKNKESLLEIISNEAISEKEKEAAITQMADITGNSEKEIAAELLLEAKGFNGVVVSMLDGNVDVVVNMSSITDVQRAQIEDIVKRKTGVSTDKITINICNNLNN